MVALQQQMCFLFDLYMYLQIIEHSQEAKYYKISANNLITILSASVSPSAVVFSTTSDCCFASRTL